MMKEEIENAWVVLKKGGLILYPTDTVWGIGCDATNADAVAKIYALKKRSETQSMIVLMNGDTLTGLVKYNVEGNVVQYDNKRQVKAFSSQKVLFFEIFDQIFESYRQFYALPYHVQANYKTPILFEVLFEGTLTLLAREYVVEESVPVYSYYSRHHYSTRSTLAFDYFFLDREGNIEKYNLKKNDLYATLKNKEGEVKQFMKKNNLRYDRREDLVRIVAYYNSLIEDKI